MILGKSPSYLGHTLFIGKLGIITVFFPALPGELNEMLYVKDLYMPGWE